MDEQDKKTIDGFAGYALAALMLAYADAKSRGDVEMRSLIDSALAALEAVAAEAAQCAALAPIHAAARRSLEKLSADAP